MLESYVRKGFFALDKKERQDGRDIMWYIGSTPDSPLFGKNKMATFERYFLAEKETHVEKKNPYYALLENEEAIEKGKGYSFGNHGREAGDGQDTGRRH